MERTTTIGSQVASSDLIAKSIDAMVHEIAEHSKQLTGVRGPIAELQSSYQAQLEAAGKDRGRGLWLPYISSGLGNGGLVELADGSVKWDMICGIGVHFFGHSHPELVRAAIAAGVEDTAKHGNLQAGSGGFGFARKLVELASRNSRLRHAFVTTSGAMANESVIKVCYQKHAPATRVIAFEHCFMGRSVTMANIGDNAAARVGIPLTTQVDYMPFYTDGAAEQMGGETRFIDYACGRLQGYIDRYPKQHACFIFELVQGEGGLNKGKKEFFRALMEMCKANSIAVWDDEIQSFGRTTEMFAYETYGVGEYVDVLCVGKMTQACAAMYTEDYNPAPGLLSGTFTGSSSDFTVGTRILELLDEGNFHGADGRIESHHREFRKHAKALIDKHPAWFPKVPGLGDLVDGVGGMMRFTPFGGDKAKISSAVRSCFEHGVVLFYCGHGPYHMRLLPPLGALQLESWPDIFACIERGLAAAAG